MLEHMDLMFDAYNELQVRTKFTKVVWVNFEDFPLKSQFFRELHQVCLNRKERREEAQNKMDLIGIEFDVGLDLLDGQFDNLRAVLSDMVSIFNKDVDSQWWEYLKINIDQVRSDIIGKDVLLCKEDEEHLNQKIRRFHKEKLEELEGLKLSDVYEIYSSRFSALMDTMKLNFGYHLPKGMFIKTNLSKLFQMDQVDLWRLQISIGEFACMVDIEAKVVKLKLDELYYSASVCCVHDSNDCRLNFIGKVGNTKIFFLPPGKELLSRYSVDDCVLFKFSNDRS